MTGKFAGFSDFQGSCGNKVNALLLGLRANLDILLDPAPDCLRILTKSSFLFLCESGRNGSAVIGHNFVEDSRIQHIGIVNVLRVSILQMKCCVHMAL